MTSKLKLPLPKLQSKLMLTKSDLLSILSEIKLVPLFTTTGKKSPPTLRLLAKIAVPTQSAKNLLHTVLTLTTTLIILLLSNG